MIASPSRQFLSTFRASLFRETTSKSSLSRSICSSCLSKAIRANNNVAPRTTKRNFFSSRHNYQNKERTQTYRNPVDDPAFVSLIDQPVQLVRQKRRHGPGLIILGRAMFSCASHCCQYLLKKTILEHQHEYIC